MSAALASSMGMVGLRGRVSEEERKRIEAGLARGYRP